MTLNSPTRIDPRGVRFAAALTSAVLAASLIAGPVRGLPALLLQLAAFSLGALLGLRYQPYGWIFRRFLRPRLGPPAQLEDEQPPRFAQSVGLVFTALALLGALTGQVWLFFLATGFALAAALLNAAFNFCLGCEFYLLIQRLRRAPRAAGVEAGR